jgi:hypothetical protein
LYSPKVVPSRYRIAILLLVLLATAHARATVIEQFWVPGAQADQCARISAVLLHDGAHGRIWVDVRDTARVSQQAMASIARALDVATPTGSRDPSRGIIENVQTVFGPSPDRFKRGGKDDFLLTDLQNRAEGVTMLGTFMSKDQRPTTEQPYSNERNILYIDSREGMEDLPALLATTAHEYQHLIHFGMNPNAEQLFNEGCSELASKLVGYADANGDYLANTNVPLMRWGGHHSAGLDADYQRGMSLMVYLHEQFGDRFIREFVASTASGVERIGQAVDRAGISSARYSWQSVLRDFALANYLQTEGTGARGYRQRLDPARSVHEASLVIGTPHGISTAPDVQLEPFGSSFHLYDQPGALRLYIEPNMGYQAVAILYYGGRPRIVELTPGREERIGSDGASPDRVVLAFISLTAKPVDVRWHVSGDESSTSSAMADASDQVFSALQITPNPSSGSTVLSFETSVGGALRLDLFTSAGQRIATVVDGVVINPGHYQLRFDTKGFSPGAYMTRLTVGERAATREVIVAGQ